MKLKVLCDPVASCLGPICGKIDCRVRSGWLSCDWERHEACHDLLGILAY